MSRVSMFGSSKQIGGEKLKGSLVRHHTNNNGHETSNEYSPVKPLMQTQSVSRGEITDSPHFDELEIPAVGTKNQQQLKSKIAKLTTIYSNPSLKKPAPPPQIHRKATGESLALEDSAQGSKTLLPNDIRSIIGAAESIGQSASTRDATRNSSTRAINGQRLVEVQARLKGVIPPSLRLGKAFMQHQLLTPQHTLAPALASLIGRAPVVRPTEIEESKHLSGVRMNPKTNFRRIAESCSRSTATNSSSVRQDCSAKVGDRKARSQVRDRRLNEVMEKVKTVIDRCKKREEVLVMENRSLKENVASLQKALSACQDQLMRQQTDK